VGSVLAHWCEPLSGAVAASNGIDGAFPEKPVNLRPQAHIRTRSYTLRTNGKAQWFRQTTCKELTEGMSFNNSDQRVGGLPCNLDIYNRLRNDSSLGWRSPQQQLAKLIL